MATDLATQVTRGAGCRKAVLFRDGLAPRDVAASLLCTVPESTYVVHDAESLSQALVAAEEGRLRGNVAVFALDYELGALLEPAVQKALPANDRTGTPKISVGHIWLFREARWLTHAEADVWLQEGSESEAEADSDPDADEVAGCVRGAPALDAWGYAEKIRQIRDAIAEGEVYQVNFTFPMDAAIYGAPARVFLNLAQAQPTASAVFVDMPEYQALSLSPELFFAVDDDRITVRPMKGTAPRSSDPLTDRKNAEALQASQKNRAENLMIVDLLRNDLGRVAVPGSVAVERLFEIEAYPTVHQMTSSVSARLQTTRLADLIYGLFPCGSVTGAPKVAAMQKIRAMENAPRGLYTGSIGWATEKQMAANVAIRTLVLDPPIEPGAPFRTGVLGVGSGIVWDSDPQEEYAECLLKSAFLVRPDPGFSLFETLRLVLPPDDLMSTLPLDEIYPQVRGHVARLAQSSYALGFAFDAAAFETALWEIKREIWQKLGPCESARLCRVRIDLSHAGGLSSSWSLLPPIAERVALIWSDSRLKSGSPLLRHKISARAVYDAAIENAMAQQAFDSLFCNQQGEVCEGARSNVFVREGHRLLTPPLRCGLLPGVLRAALIESGEAREAILTVADIKAASREGRLRVGNALRGLMPAYLK